LQRSRTLKKDLPEFCKVPFCDKSHYAKGYCIRHYNQFYTLGKILIDKPKYDHCTVDGCEQKHVAHGYCNRHYRQFKKYGEIKNFGNRTKYDPNEIIIKEDFAYIHLYDPLGNYKARTKIDIKDIELCSGIKWYAGPNYVESKTHGFLHQHIMGIKRPDHIDGNSFDNRRINLRPATSSQNSQNRSKQTNNTSGYKGVMKSGKKWMARIGVDRKYFVLGYFKNIINAAIAYDQAALKHHGEFARLNFPQGG